MKSLFLFPILFFVFQTVKAETPINANYDLRNALVSGNQEKVDELIKVGANVNSQVVADSFVSWASSLGISLTKEEYNSKIKKLEFMLKNGVDINSLGSDQSGVEGAKETALTGLLSSSCNDTLISSVEYLLTKGINPKLKNAVYRYTTDKKSIFFWGSYTALEKINGLSFEGGQQMICRNKIRDLLFNAEKTNGIIL